MVNFTDAEKTKINHDSFKKLISNVFETFKTQQREYNRVKFIGFINLNKKAHVFSDIDNIDELNVLFETSEPPSLLFLQRCDKDERISIGFHDYDHYILSLNKEILFFKNDILRNIFVLN